MKLLTSKNWCGGELRKVVRKSRPKKIQEFSIPELNFECKDYNIIMFWQSIDVTEPHATKAISDPDVDNHIAAKHLFEVSRYPIHTQAVERPIQLVRMASSQVCAKKREKVILKLVLLQENEFRSMRLRRIFPHCKIIIWTVQRKLIEMHEVAVNISNWTLWKHFFVATDKLFQTGL